MEGKVLQEALVQQKRIYTLLNETLDVSCQLAEAVDRDDQVTIQMLVSMRAEPVQKLRLARTALEEQRDDLAGPERTRFAALLNGAPAESGEEQPLAEQVAANNRLLQRVLDVDKTLNQKLTREQSVY